MACVLDAMIPGHKRPRVMFEVVSPSELQCKRQRGQRRTDLQAIYGVKCCISDAYHIT